ncbi:MAG: PAS domain-containing protein, partial [Desulfomonilaceae bacterium]|nr:PAS domain-containing protein [Desulfomonilaceae bacterium]
PIPTLLLDSSLTVVFANEAWGKISPNHFTVTGSHFSSFIPGGTEREHILGVLENVLSERRTQVSEGLLQIGGKILWCRIHFRSIRFRKQRSILAIIEDLTAEKKQLILNEKYQKLVNIFPIGISEFLLEDPLSLQNGADDIIDSLGDAELIGGNLQFARMYGHADIDSLKRMRLREIFPFDVNYRRQYRWWVDRGFAVHTFETRQRDADGSPRYYEMTLVGNVKNNKIAGFWAMRQDITQRKEAEAGLRAARDSLEERVRQRTTELMQTTQQLTVEIGERQKAEEELTTLVRQLRNALAKVKILSGLLPICASCKKIRDDRGYWTQVEVYVREHSDADFTHSICPDCAKKLYPDFFDPGYCR